MRWTLSMRWLAGCFTLAVALAGAERLAADVVAEPAAAPADTAIVLQDHVNVRARAGTGSEVIAQVRKGQHVIVLEEIPSAATRGTNAANGWYKIALTNRTSAWVSRHFVSSNRVVTSKALNLRSGPGEEFQLLGRVNKGAKLKVEETKGDWLRIETGKPTYGYVAASLLKQQPITLPTAPIVAEVPPAARPRRTAPPSAPPVRVAPVPASPPVVTEVQPVPAPPPASATGNPVPIALTPPPTPTAPPVTPPAETVVAVAPPVTPSPATPPVATPPPAIAPAAPVAVAAGAGAAPAAAGTSTNVPALPPVNVPMPSAVPPPGVDVHVDRLVAREGTLRAAINIQAPAYHELLSIHSGKVINYLYTTNIDLKPFRGKRVIVSGREYLDKRWLLTPVLVIDTLETVTDP